MTLSVIARSPTEADDEAISTIPKSETVVLHFDF